MSEKGRSNFDEKNLLTQQQRELFSLKLLKRGLDTFDCVAYHETSLESLCLLITSGKIPGHTGRKYDNPRYPQPGDIYFIPRREVFPFEKVPTLWNDDDIQPSKADDIHIFNDSAISHRFCSLLGISIAEYSHHALEYVDYEILENGNDHCAESRAILRAMSFTEEQMSSAAKTARIRKGVLLGLSRSALDKYPLSEGDGGFDIRLSPGREGLPITAFSGIKLLGEEEKIFFEKLETKHNFQ